MNGLEIKKLREQFKMSQSTFASKLAISKSYLSMIESDKRQPSVKLLNKIRNVFVLEGGKVPTEAKIDFIRIRFSVDAPDEVIEKVLRMDATQFGYRDYGFHHYTETYYFSEISVYANPCRLDMGVTVEMRGQGCREYELVLEEHNETWQDFFWRLYEQNLFDEGRTIETKITRIDLALDELISPTYPNYNLYELKEKMEAGLVDTTFRTYDFKGGFDMKKGKLVNKGLSLYFGSRQSPMYFNFYQKDYELAKKEELSVEMAREKFGIKNRYEVRLADDKAYLFVEYLLSTGETVEWVVRELIDTSIKVFECDSEGGRTNFCLNWRNVIDSMQELRLTMKGEKPNYHKALRWLSNYLAPTLKKIWLIDQTLGKNELMERIQQAEFKDKDMEEIAKVTTKIKELLVAEPREESSTQERIAVSEEEIEQFLAQYLF